MLKKAISFNRRSIITITIIFIILCTGAFLSPATAYAVEGQQDDPADMGHYADSEFDAGAYDGGGDGLPADHGGHDFAGTAEDAAYGDTGYGYEENDFTHDYWPFDLDFSYEALLGNLTPDGTATVVDNIFLERSGLEFFTFTTDAGNIFYLVIDRTRDGNNVYFLNAVNERSLLALAEAAEIPDDYTVSGIPEPPGDFSEHEEEPEGPDNAAEEPPALGGMNGTTIFIIIGAALFGIIAYYLKIVRPKRRAAEDDGYDESEGYDDDDGYINYGGPDGTGPEK